MGKTKIGVGGNLDYMVFLLEHYGKDADMKTVWEGEQKRLALARQEATERAQNQNSNK